MRDLGSIPGVGRFPGEGNGYPLQYSGLENSMDCIVHWGHKELDMTELAGDKGRGEGGWMLGRQLTQYLFFRYMQSFLELLEYENKSPEDPQVLDK